jgi:CP12 domain
MSNTKLQNEIEQERTNARTVCDVNGPTSPDCAAAWDVVEELQAEAAHQTQNKPKTNFESYCNDNPDAIECRIHEN